MDGENFQFYTPLSFFEKADAPEGSRRRVAGLISTERKDRQDETVLQRGLDFSEFIDFGWYNDNHAKDMAGVVGYPESRKTAALAFASGTAGETPWVRAMFRNESVTDYYDREDAPG